MTKSIENQNFNHGVAFKVRQFICQIQDVIDLDDHSFSELMETQSEVLTLIKAGTIECSLKSLFALCENLEISMSQVLKGEVDLKTLERQFHGNSLILPEKYQDPKYHLGKARAILGLFDYLDYYYGKECSRNIRRRMQIRSAAFTDPLLPVSPMILIDALEYAKEVGLSDAEIKMTGTHNLVINRDSILGKILAAKSSPADLYRSIHEELRGYYDQLFDYKLTQLNEESCTIRVEMNELSQDIFSTYTLGNRQVCLYKQGVYMSFLGNIQEGLADIKESQCMYRGQKSCIYHLTW